MLLTVVDFHSKRCHKYRIRPLYSQYGFELYCAIFEKIFLPWIVIWTGARSGTLLIAPFPGET